MKGEKLVLGTEKAKIDPFLRAFSTWWHGKSMSQQNVSPNKTSQISETSKISRSFERKTVGIMLSVKITFERGYLHYWLNFFSIMVRTHYTQPWRLTQTAKKKLAIKGKINISAAPARLPASSPSSRGRCFISGGRGCPLAFCCQPGLNTWGRIVPCLHAHCSFFRTRGV